MDDFLSIIIDGKDPSVSSSEEMRTVSVADHMAVNQLTVSLDQLTALGIDDVVRVGAKLVLALGRLTTEDYEIRMI